MISCTYLVNSSEFSRIIYDHSLNSFFFLPTKVIAVNEEEKQGSVSNLVSVIGPELRLTVVTEEKWKDCFAIAQDHKSNRLPIILGFKRSKDDEF